MNANDYKLLNEQYDLMLLEGKLVNVLGNLAVDFIKYINCKQSRNKQCGTMARDLVSKLLVWANENKQSPYVEAISNIVNNKSDPDHIIMDIYHYLRYGYGPSQPSQPSQK